MTDKPEKYIIDPSDGMRAEVVGEWVVNEKHKRITYYVNATRWARKQYIDQAGATFIDLFCGPGRVNTRGTHIFEDGGVVAACRNARDSGVPFNEVHIGDIDTENVDTCASRLKEMGENVIPHYGAAEQTVGDVVEKLDPFGLHLAYLDPYNLQALPFAIIKKLSNFKRMDMLMHVSAQDLQRNLEKFIKSQTSPLDSFAPGWRDVIKNPSLPNRAMRADVLEHWIELVRQLGMNPSKKFALITGSKNQRLYWLAFASKNPFPDKIWNEISNLNKQGTLL
ncbi:three-Cys-motif partner protein TcmP [Pseudomonadota bacterium]